MNPKGFFYIKGDGYGAWLALFREKSWFKGTSKRDQKCWPVKWKNRIIRFILNKMCQLADKVSVELPETLSVTYANNLVLSTDRDGILRDVESMKNQSLEIVNSVEKHKATVDSCDKILEEWNPAFAEKKEQDKRISGLEEKVEGIGKMLSDFINEFKK